MTIYIFSLLIFIFLSIVLKAYYEINQRKSQILIIFTFIVIFGVLAGIRHFEVGTDTKLYSSLFLSSGMNSTWENIATSKYPVYDLYSSVLYRVNDNPQIMIFVNSLIIICSVGYSVKKLSLQPYTSCILYITLYFYFNSMNISRQYIAMGLLLIGVTFLLDNKIKHYFIIYVLAVLVHSTAIFGIVFYLLYRIKWTSKKFVILVILGGILPSILDKLLQLYVSFFPYYEMYGNTQSATDNITSQSEGNKILLSLFYLVFLIIGLYIRNRKEIIDQKKFDFLNAIVLMGVLIGIIFYKNILISRVEMYFTIFMIIYIPETIENFNLIYLKNIQTRKKIKFLIYFTVILISMIPMFFQLNKGISGVIPYKFFFD